MNESIKSFFIFMFIILFSVFIWISAFFYKNTSNQNEITKVNISDTILYTALINKDVLKLSSFSEKDNGISFNTNEYLYTKSIDDLVNNWTGIVLKNTDKAIIFIIDEYKDNSWVEVLNKEEYLQLSEDLNTGFITINKLYINNNSKFFQAPININGSLNWYLFQAN